MCRAVDTLGRCEEGEPKTNQISRTEIKALCTD